MGMLDFCRKHRGSIALIMCLILVPMIVISGLVIDGTRITVARSSLSGAADLTMASALTNYDQVIKDVYGVFAISKDMDELNANLERYFTNTVNAELKLLGVEHQEDGDHTAYAVINSLSEALTDAKNGNGLMKMDDASVKIAGVQGSELSNSKALERQIIEYMKYRGPVNLVGGVLEKFNMFSQVKKQNEVAKKEVAFEKKLNEVQKACVNLYKVLIEYRSGLETNDAGVNYTDPEAMRKDIYTRINQAVVCLNQAAFYMAINNSEVLKAAEYTAKVEDSWKLPTYGNYDVDSLLKDDSKGTSFVREAAEMLNKYLDISSEMTGEGQKFKNAVETLVPNLTVKISDDSDTVWEDGKGYNISNLDDEVYKGTRENVQALTDCVRYWNLYQDNATPGFVGVGTWAGRCNQVILAAQKVNNIYGIYTSLKDEKTSLEGAITSSQSTLSDALEKIPFVYISVSDGEYIFDQDALEDDIEDLEDEIDDLEESIKAVQKEGGDTSDLEETLEDKNEELDELNEALDVIDGAEKAQKTIKESQPKLDRCNNILNGLASGNARNAFHNEAQVISTSSVNAVVRNANGILSAFEKCKQNADNCAGDGKDTGIITKHAKNLLNKSQMLVSTPHRIFKSLISTLNKAAGKCDDVVEAVKKVESRREEWKTSIDDMNDGTIKTTMENKYDQSAEDLKEDDINSLKTLIGTLKTRITDVDTLLKSVKMGNTVMATDSGDSLGTKLLHNYTGTVLPTGGGKYVLKNSDVTIANETRPEHPSNDCHTKAGLAALSQGKALSLGEYKQVTWNEESLKTYKASPMSDEMKKSLTLNLNNQKEEGEDEGQEFWRYLHRTCAALASETSGSSGGKSKKKNVLSKSSDSKNETSSELSEQGIEEILSIAGLNSSDTDVSIETSTDDSEQKNSDAMLKNQGDGNSEGGISKLLTSLADLGNNMGTSIYLEEYMTEMFSCYTTNLDNKKENAKLRVDLPEANPATDFDKLDTMLSGYVIKANSTSALYRAEQEYIVWGKGTPKENVDAALTTMYGIRLVLNTIYALTSSSLNSETLQIATAVAGWTGFGVPLVQTVLDIALAMVESGIDINLLKNGQDVAFYKNKNTWVMSVENAAKDGADLVVTELSAKLLDEASSLTESLFDVVDKYLNGQGEVGQDEVNQVISLVKQDIDTSFQDSVESMLTVPMTQCGLQIIGDMHEYADPEGEIDAALNTAFQETLENIENQEDSPAKTYEKEIYNALIATNAKSVLKQLFAEKREELMVLSDQVEEKDDDSVNSYFEQVGKIQQEVTSRIEEIVNRARINSTAADRVVKEKTTALENELKEVMKTEKDQVKEKMADAIKNYKKDINGSKGDTSNSDAGFKLGYKDYMKVLTMVYLLGSRKDAMLERTSQVMIANVNTSKSEAPFIRKTLGKEWTFKRYKSEEGAIDASKCYTMVSADATAKMQTLFMNLNLAQHQDEQGRVFYDYSWAGSNKDVNVSYIGVEGY